MYNNYINKSIMKITSYSRRAEQFEIKLKCLIFKTLSITTEITVSQYDVDMFFLFKTKRRI